MRKTALLFVAAAVAVSTLAVSKEAHALGPLSLEVAINAGYGTNPDNGAGNPPNPLGVGLGGRAGVSILGFYGGIDGEYYFGGSDSGVSVNTVKYGAQLGYNLGIPFLTIRPQVGLGNATFSFSDSQLNVSSSSSSFYVEPGLVGIIGFGMWFIGADANGLIFTAYPRGGGNTSLQAAFTAHGQVGLTF